MPPKRRKTKPSTKASKGSKRATTKIPSRRPPAAKPPVPFDPISRVGQTTRYRRPIHVRARSRTVGAPAARLPIFRPALVKRPGMAPLAVRSNVPIRRPVAVRTSAHVPPCRVAGPSARFVRIREEYY